MQKFANFASGNGRKKIRLAVLLLVVLFLGCVSFAAISWWVGGRLAAATHVAVGPGPDDLPVEVLEIPSTSGSSLASWFLPGRRGLGAVILLHSVRGNRLALLPRARVLSAAGFSVLLFDFQAHGESPGDRITFGHLESRDVRCALAYLRRRLPDERIGLFGTSLGGAAILLGDTPVDADAVVLEAVYPTIAEAVSNRIRLRLGPLARVLTPVLLLQLEPRLGVSPSSLRPIDRIPSLRAPLLVVAGENDRHTTLRESQRLFAAANEPKELWVIDGAAHIDFHTYVGPEYERRILSFFSRYLRE
ncbi:MAG: alpha/beta hydrolase [bacterium]|nr:alpha/beta hydrolase [bacterium]